jgi:hypothetical protein
MTSKNRGFAAGLAGALDAEPTGLDKTVQPSARTGVGVLTARGDHIAELASGSLAPERPRRDRRTDGPW